MTQTEALKLALEAFKLIAAQDQGCGGNVSEAEAWKSAQSIALANIITIKEALAQPEQEPVAWRELCRRLYVELFHCNAQMTYGSRPKWRAGKEVLDVLADAETALDDAPPQRTWVVLTDAEIDQGLLRTNYAMQTARAWRDGVTWAYHQLKEKNNA